MGEMERPKPHLTASTYDARYPRRDYSVDPPSPPVSGVAILWILVTIICGAIIAVGGEVVLEWLLALILGACLFLGVGWLLVRFALGPPR